MSSPIRTSFLSPKTEVRASAIQGRGLFAREETSQGEIVAIKGGQIFDRAARDILQRSLGPAEIQIGEDLFIGPTTEAEREASMIFSNHSCDPNIGVQGQIAFVAVRAVRAGEELTHDWATMDCDDYEMPCNCGAAECRRTITGQDWRRQELQTKYRGYFSWYLEMKIRDKERP